MFLSIACIALLSLLCACASIAPQDEAQKLLASGQIEAAVKRMDDAVDAAPRDVVLRAERARLRERAATHYLMLAESQRANDQGDAAHSSYLKLLALEPGNARAQQGLQALEAETRHRELYAQALTQMQAAQEDSARALLQQILRENPQQRDARTLLRNLEERQARREASEPQLKIDLQKTVNFDLRDATLRAAFDFVTQASGLNVFFDKEVKTDQRLSVNAKDIRLENLVQLILMTQQLERKVVADNAILVYPATPQKIREHQDLISRTFYLANADVRQVQNLLRTMVKTKDIYVDEKLNLLVMRDTPEAVRYAEKLIAAHDLAEPEVMLQVEVMEIARNRLSELGARFPDQFSLTPTAAGSAGASAPGTLPLYDLLNINSRLLQFTITNPSLVINLKSQEGLTNLLANPRIRVKNREKARVLIGDRVPVITSTSTSTGFLAESVNYLDVGIRLEVEPNVFLEDEVQIKVGLEVSNIAREIRSSTGTLTYQVGTRNAATTLRLRDGETQVLAGLINDEDRSNSAQVPGLSSLPIAGRLFSSTAQTRNKTEIVLLITPRILRSIQRPDASVSEFYAGTEAAMGARPLFLKKTSESAAPAAVSNAAPTTPAIASPAPATPTQPAPEAALTPTVTAPAAATPINTPTPPAVSSLTPPNPIPVVPGGPGVAANLRVIGPSQVRPGEVFELAVHLSSTQNATRAVLGLQLDPALQFVDAQAASATEGFFERGGARATLNVLPDSSGAVQLNVTSDSAKGVVGQGELVLLRLRALSAAPGSAVAFSAFQVMGEGGAALPVAVPPAYVVRVAP